MGHENMEPTNHEPPESRSPAVSGRLPPPPRAAARRPGRRGLLGHAPLTVRLLCLGGLGLLLVALWLVASSWVVRRFGMTVPGEVAARSPGPKGTREGRVQFTYVVKGQEYSAEEAVDEAALDRLHSGAQVQVRVLSAWPSRPLLVEPAGHAGRGNGVALAFALLGNVALGVLLRRCLREPLKQRALVREGIATEGVVVRKEVGSGRRASWGVQYCYRAPRHGAAPAVADKEWQVRMAVGRADFEAVQVGATVLVLYDPRQPSRSVIYPFAAYEAIDPSADPPSGEWRGERPA